MPKAVPVQVRVAISDSDVDETWLELTVQDIWGMVKRARNRKSVMSDSLVLWFGTTAVEVTVMKVEG